MKSCWFCRELACVTVIGLFVVQAALAQPAVGRPQIGIAPLPGGAGNKAEAKMPWNEAELVFTAMLQSAEAGPVAQSFPPIYHHSLHLHVERVLRGELKTDLTMTANHSARQQNSPTFPVGKVCLVAASKSRGNLRVERIEAASEEAIKQVELQCSLPLGWKIADGQPLSPWAGLGAKAWSGGDLGDASLKCQKTGRPALLAGGVNFEVEKVPPAKDIKWTNPDGDGEYKITVSNPTDKSVVVPALLSDGDRILWEESLVVLCQGKAYPCPGAAGVGAGVEPVQLAPGESLSTVVNALRLDGPEWPRGGYRIEFQFCLGEKSRTMSFYYMSRHHDPIREQLKDE